MLPWILEDALLIPLAVGLCILFCMRIGYEQKQLPCKLRPSSLDAHRPAKYALRVRPRPHYTGGIWKRKFRSENESNVFCPHYVGGIWTRRFHSENSSVFFVHTTLEEFENRRFHPENSSNVFRPHYARGIWNRRFHSENGSNVFRPHYVGGIWNRSFHPENASNVFCPHYAGWIKKRVNHRSCWVCVWGKHIFAWSSFSKSSVSNWNVFCPHKNGNPAFSNSSGLTSVLRKLRFCGG